MTFDFKHALVTIGDGDINMVSKTGSEVVQLSPHELEKVAHKVEELRHKG